MRKPGQVFLVGAGPGDPELLTLKAARILCQAQAVVYDRLVSEEVLELSPPLARLVPVGKAPKSHPVPQERINQILIELASEGLTVVRLKGGDPMVFGRGSEEAAALRAAGIPFEIVPGITAAQGAAAATAVPLTHRGLASGVRYVTGHCREDRPLDLDWAGLADPQTTLVVYMGAGAIAEIAGRLLGEGLPAAHPVMAVAGATTPHERRLVSSLGEIAGDAARASLRGPVLFVIGEVVSLYRSRPEAIVTLLASRPRKGAAYA
ncbi:uroporphyrinogen-III C-methyltransferase [Pelagibius sp. CAU 1746]|uniref:uroporphyrinogen-III C-methyltransferase n=1 Tax=Pelagibius sp. CAU 1746 TaxID=3140370 RepID=UPI00325BEF65